MRYFFMRWARNAFFIMSMTFALLLLTPDRMMQFQWVWIGWVFLLSGAMAAMSAYRWWEQSRDMALISAQYKEMTKSYRNANQVLLPPDASLYPLSREFNEMQTTVRRELIANRRQVASYETLFENLPIGVLTVDYRHRIVDMNDAAWQMLERRRVTLPTNEHDILKHFILVEIIRRTFEKRENIRQVVALNIGGKQRQIEITTLLHQPTSDRDEVIVLLYDLTTMLTLEQMQADFLANASHEFKTPLTAINGFIETLQGPAGADATLREQFLGIIESEARRMTDLVNDVLSLSRIQHGQTVAENSIIPLAHFTDELWQTLQESAQQKNITFKNTIAPDIEISSTPETLKALVVNLLSNAVKYNQENGQIEVSAQVEKNVWSLRVKDSGIGIPTSQQTRIFERFYRGDASRQRRIADGTGLGLAIVSELVQQLNGQIHLQSQVGVGTTFTITLPK